jgi:hypothetical protein
MFWSKFLISRISHQADLVHVRVRIKTFAVNDCVFLRDISRQIQPHCLFANIQEKSFINELMLPIISIFFHVSFILTTLLQHLMRSSCTYFITLFGSVHLWPSWLQAIADQKFDIIKLLASQPDKDFSCRTAICELEDLLVDITAHYLLVQKLFQSLIPHEVNELIEWGTHYVLW